MAWQPISEAELRNEIIAAEARMNTPQRRFWESTRIKPEKWKLQPYGNAGNGFWAVGIIGRTVVWFNDIEDGFNHSSYRQYGEIADYFCNQDGLETAVQQLISIMETGHDSGTRCGRPIAVSE